MSIEESLVCWQKENFNHAFAMMQEALEMAKESHDIVKQKYCAEYFDISVNTLKDWVNHGCPEIRLDSGMVLYSKCAVREWLLQYQR
ncbi:DNA-binding protein [Enterococcus ratti]|uniref:Helix-turn-helix domain-containing protein n=1 Tax=Enterococcus ratti TaxID=150033 RepID=A0A1L8WQ46_9ENTE|nr:DNA-binding protein [Enterococcus ratti]OJG83139.1 hypothetical protein RV14_GL001834 [Enterococcus ratti]